MTRKMSSPWALFANPWRTFCFGQSLNKCGHDSKNVVAMGTFWNSVADFLFWLCLKKSGQGQFADLQSCDYPYSPRSKIACYKIIQPRPTTFTQIIASEKTCVLHQFTFSNRGYRQLLYSVYRWDRISPGSDQISAQSSNSRRS